MAWPPEPADNASSDYGSDFSDGEVAILSQLVDKAERLESQPPLLPLSDDDDDEQPQLLRLPGADAADGPASTSASEAVEEASSRADGEYLLGVRVEGLVGDDGHGLTAGDPIRRPAERVLTTDDPTVAPQTQASEATSDADADEDDAFPVELPGVPLEPSGADPRSPLARFRSPPRKALSVTDLVSPAWCELQYWYALTSPRGRVRRTRAMRQGSAVHQRLEDAVHRRVEVPVRTREDAYALRIWNVIQGLQTLRQTGMTRELELWGVRGGQVVTGVVDELSYICPDRDLEEQAEKGKEEERIWKGTLEEGQTTLAEFLKATTKKQRQSRANENAGDNTDGVNGAEDSNVSLRSLRKRTSKVYLTDVKTRGANTAVPRGAAFRPTFYQLMLYRLLLADLVAGRVDGGAIFTRNRLNPNAPLSDGFIAQVGELADAFYDAPASPEESEDLPASSFPGSNTERDATDVLLANNSLAKLWRVMLDAYATTFPRGEASVGKVLKAEYRDPVSGDVRGMKTFLYDVGAVEEWVADELRWWKGEREARGVAIEEAYKCRMCDFAEGCEWRAQKVEEARVAFREKGRSRSTV